MPPYVGMARKQNGGYNASINVQTPIVHLVVNSTRPKTVRSALWCCPNTTVALTLLVNVVYPGSFEGAEKRAWSTLSAHAFNFLLFQESVTFLFMFVLCYAA